MDVSSFSRHCFTSASETIGSTDGKARLMQYGVPGRCLHKNL